VAEEEKNPNTIDNLEGSSSEESSPSGDAPLAELAAKDEELKALNDKYLRLAAEFDNYKRLAQRDQRDQIRFGH